MMKQYLLVTVALLAVMGCQRRPLGGDDPVGEACVVRFQAENLVEVESASKATTQVDLTPGSTVRVIAYQRQGSGQANPDLTKDLWKATSTYKVQSDFTLVPCNVNDDGTENTTVGTAAKGMELHNGTYDFYAYSPARKLETDNQTVSGLGHYEDFMGAYTWSQTISRSSSTVALAFEHECAKVTFTIVHDVGMSSSDLFVDDVVLRKIATTDPVVTYTIGGDLTPTVGTTADTGIIRTFAYVDATKKGDGAFGHAIFLPKDKETIPAEFYIKVNDTHYLLKADLPEMAFEKGHNYMYTAKVKQGSVDLVLNVVSWNHVVQNNSDMGADNGSILIGSWGGIDWSGSMGGNPDEATAPIQVGSWTGVNLPADFIGGQPGQVSGWGDTKQDLTEFGK